MDSEQQRDDANSGVSRRAYLGAIGAASASTALFGRVGADESQYDEVVDIVEAGADNSGDEPIDAVFDEHAADDTLIKFPAGTYRANQLNLYQLSNFAMVGDDATLVPGDSYDEDLWIAGAEVEDLRIENFTIDNTADGVAPEVTLSAYDDLVIRDVDKVGYHEGTGIAFAFRMLDGGNATVERLVARDGGKCVGIYADGDGTMTFRDCELEGFTNNGLYASRVEGAVTVEGGVYKDCNISQIRLGSPNSTVRGATIEVTRPVEGPDSDVVNMRGIRVADGTGPVVVDDCDISMRGAQGTGGIVTAYSGGSLEVYDTRIFIDEDYTTTAEGSDRASWGIFVDEENGVDQGSRTFENVSITGGGRFMSAMLIRRDNNTMQGLCIDQLGESRDGIILENSSNNTLTDSIIDVPDEEVVLHDSSVTRANVSTSGNCPTPDVDGTSSETSTADSSPAVQLEVGDVTVEQPTADEWHGVGFAETYDDPVVVAQGLTYEDSAPCHPRIRSVSTQGFELKCEEWMYQDGQHGPETVRFAALESGRYDADGHALESGHLSTDDGFSRQSFEGSFDDRPVVFAQPETFEGPNPIVPRLRDVSTDGFEVMLQEEEGESNGGAHRFERVGYLAIEPGSGTLDGRAFEVGTASVHEEWQYVSFENRYENPQFVAGIQTFEGPNTANVRYRNLTGDGVEVVVEEEQSADEETLHVRERVGYAVVDDV